MMARGLKFWISEVEGLYYLFSETSFAYAKKKGFLMTRPILERVRRLRSELWLSHIRFVLIHAIKSFLICIFEGLVISHFGFVDRHQDIMSV